MTRRAAFKQSDVARLVAGALQGGLPAGSFALEVVDGIVRLLPMAPGSQVTSADSSEAEWDKALGLR